MPTEAAVVTTTSRARGYRAESAAMRAMRALPAILALIAMPAAAEPSAQMLADTCAMCHGTDGVSAGVLDSLRDMSAREIEEEMLEFKNAGKGRIMAPLARAYSDAQIRAIAEHLARGGGGQ